MQRFVVGSVEVVPVVQLTYLVQPAKFFAQLDDPRLDPDGWYLRPPYVDAQSGRLRIDMGGFLVRTLGRRILIDLGIGNGKTRPNPVFDHRADDWLGTLAAAGATPAEVDTVVFTHLHVDHVGNATRFDGGRWTPVFDRARHLTTAAELDFWTGPKTGPEVARLGDYVGDSVRPLLDAGLVDVVAPDHVLTDEIRLEPAPGHTPGNVSVVVESEGHRAVFCGDMVHHPLQLAFPDWSTNFCLDAGQAAAARRQLLAGLAGTGDWLIPAHLPGSVPVRVVSDGDAYGLEPVAG